MSRIDWASEFQDSLDEDNSVQEVNPNTMRASSVGYCPRQMFLGKMGLKEFNDYVQGMMIKGTAIHSVFEDNMRHRFDDAEFEENVLIETPENFDITGRFDAFDGEAVMDLKTQNGGMENVAQSPRDKHIDQLHVYMKGKGVEKGELLYLDAREFLNYKNVVTVSHKIEFDDDRWAEILSRISKVLKEVRKYDLGQKEESKFSLDAEDIPFEKCGCYFCKNESLNLDRYIKVSSE